MFKDDRMISILSGIVLMLAIGTLIQRQELVSEYLGSDAEPEPLVLRPDAVEVAPDTLTRIDVLANDTGLPDDAADRLAVVGQPGCGRVFVQGDALQFLAEIDCEATQSFDYRLAASDVAPAAVTVTVRGATGIRNAPEPTPTRETVALAPTPASPAPTSPSLPRAATAGGAAAPALPRVMMPGAPQPDESPIDSGPARVASAPRPGTPQPTRPGSAAPGAPAPASILNGGGFGASVGAADSETSGISIASAPAPSAPRPSAPGGASPAAPRALGGLSMPGAPSLGGSGVNVAAAPSMPGSGVPRAPSVGASPSSPSMGAPSAPAAPGGSMGVAAPSMPGSGVAGRPAAPGAPSNPSIAAAPAPNPAAGAAEPAAPVLPGAIATALAAPLPDEASAVVGDTGGATADIAVPRAAMPSGIAPRATATPTIALARVEVPNQALAPTQNGVEGLELDGPDVVARDNADVGNNIGSTGGEAVAFAEPSAGLGDVMAMRDMMANIPLLDTSGPEALAAPSAMPEDQALRVGALTPATDSVVPEPSFGAAEQSLRGETEDTDSFEVVSLPSQDLACVVPPSITLDVRPAADTELGITSPCHADSVATVTYHDMTFGVPIDRSGRGTLVMHGFAPSAETVLEFADGETIDFTVPFNGIERLERVALVWEQPISLNLHAFEFGAGEGEDGHVYHGQKRDFRSVRRRGGGFMYVYKPVEGIGDSIQIYSHWVRRGGQAGVVKMYLDFESRDKDRLASTCGSGDYARPMFEVVRSSRGRLETPNVRRLAAVDCDDVGEGDRLIGAAVRDIIISQR